MLDDKQAENEILIEDSKGKGKKSSHFGCVLFEEAKDRMGIYYLWITLISSVLSAGFSLYQGY